MADTKGKSKRKALKTKRTIRVRKEKCEHDFNEDDQCNKCGQAKECILCGKYPFTSTCMHCSDGIRLCDKCITTCSHCQLAICIVCLRENNCDYA